MKKSTFKDNRGLTLVELMVGVTILAIIVVPLLHTFVVGAATESRSRTYGNATNAAQNLIEQIQATDPDTIMSNSRIVNTGANYYTLSGGVYTLYNSPTIAPPPNSGKYYIGIPNYTYGGSSFDALITLDTSTAATGATANVTPVAISNQMDALLNMSNADNNAVQELRYQCGNLVEHPDTELIASLLTRSITLNVTRSGTASPYTYSIDAVFNYTTSISYDDNGTPRVYAFTHTEQSSASVASVADSTDKSPVLSAFLFFDGYYHGNMTNDTIAINNPTGADINFFLVNTNTDDTQFSYGATISYKYQKFGANGRPVNNLVYTNLPVSAYTAWKDALTPESASVSGYLVEKKELNRKFYVIMNLYKTGSNFTGTPVLTIDSTRLNY